MIVDSNLALNFALGICVAAYGTLVGAGGGFVLVPLFLLAYRLPHDTAVGTSLVIVAANALSGTLGYVRERKIDYRAGSIFALCTFPGAFLGGLSVDLVSGPTFQKVFGVFLSLVSLYLLLRPPRQDAKALMGHKGWGWRRGSVAGESYEYFEPLGMGISLVVGAISSWLGVGGGIIHVPLMIQLLHFPVAIAVATSHFILFFTALVGVAVHLHQGHVQLPIAVSAGLGALLGAQLGVRISKRVTGGWVVRALSLALLAVGARLILL